MEQIRSELVAERRFLLLLIGAFGVLALVLAAVGVYGVMALVVSERTQEMGVRLALGAAPSEVLAMVVRQAVTLAGTGVVAGIAIATALTPLMASQLFGVPPMDPVTYLAVPLLLSWWPRWRRSCPGGGRCASTRSGHERDVGTLLSASRRAEALPYAEPNTLLGVFFAPPAWPARAWRPRPAAVPPAG